MAGDSEKTKTLAIQGTNITGTMNLLFDCNPNTKYKLSCNRIKLKKIKNKNQSHDKSPQESFIMTF